MNPSIRLHGNLRGLLMIVPFAVGAPCLNAVAAPPGSVPVTVVNSRANPVPVVPRPTTTFKRVVQLGQGGGWGAPAFEQFTVPDGKRIVIEYVSARGCIAAGYAELLIAANALSGASVGAYRFGSSERVNGMGGLQCFTINQRVRAYLEPGALVTVAFNGTALATTDFQITLDGETQDAE